MSILIVYASKYGCTEKCAKFIAKELDQPVDIFDLKPNPSIDVSNYDKVIIGGSIYIGKIQKGIQKFCRANLKELQKKKIGLFICAMGDDEAVYKELDANFPEELIQSATIKECFGGEIIIGKLDFMDKFIIHKMAKMTDTTTLDAEKCQAFAAAMK